MDAVEWAVTNPPVFARSAAVMTVQEREGRRPVTEALWADGVSQVDRAAVAGLGLALGTSTQAAQALAVLSIPGHPARHHDDRYGDVGTMMDTADGAARVARSKGQR